MKRREFLESCGLLAAVSWYPQIVTATDRQNDVASSGNELIADVVITGGGLGGCAAALSATRMGARVIMTEPTDWIGGQLTQQAVPPDEHRWIETSGCNRSYRELRSRIRDYYRNNYPLTDAARGTKNLNPGNGSVSRLCHEPRAALAALDAMLASAMSTGRLVLLLNTRPTAADVDHDTIRAVTCRTATGKDVVLRGRYFIDASEEGDLLPLTGTEYVIGAESQQQTGESHAPAKADPQNVQSFTWVYAIDHIEDEDHTIDRPEMYDFWSAHVPPLTPEWSGRLLSLSYSSPRSLSPQRLDFLPCGKETAAAKTAALNLWLYRRIIDRANFLPGWFTSDISVVNWPQNDYMLGSIIDVTEDERARHLHHAKQLSLSLLYWLQTEAPRPDGKLGWKGLRLRRDIVGTDDGLAKYPYIRESRRIQAELTILEQHVSAEARRMAVGQNEQPLVGQPFDDSVGIGSYHLDLHPSSGGDNYIDMASVPFQIPLGAMVPTRIENLIPGCKNIGTTHISNGCYRLHPVEWSIGEAAGALCAYCQNHGTTPRQVRNTHNHLRAFQAILTKHGVELQWAI